MRATDQPQQPTDGTATSTSGDASRERISHLTRRHFLSTIAAAAATAALAACGGSTATDTPKPAVGTTSPTSGTASGGASPTITVGASSAPQAAAPGKPGGKKIFRVAFSGDVQNMDSAAITTDPDNQAGEAIYNYMARYTYNPPLGTDILPDLAEKWEISPDAKVITFHLRKGAQFHRGYGDCTAEDVKWNWTRIQDEKTASRFRTDFSGGTFDVLDPLTLKVTFDRPYPSFIPAALGYVSGLIMSQKAFQELGANWKSNPVGCGPFSWGAWTPGSELTLNRFDGYWGQKPKIDQIVMRLKADERPSTLAISKGELDATYIDDPDVARDVQKNPPPNTTLLKAASGQGTYWLAFNMKHKPLDDLRVRQALRYAIDVNSIAKDLFGGFADPLYGFLPPFMFGYSDEVMKYDYNPDKARQMLKAANVPADWQPAMLGNTTSIIAHKVHEAVGSYWADVGVKVKNDLPDSGVFLKRRAAGDYDMFGIGVGRIEPDQVATPYFRSGSTVNNSFYNGVDDLIDQARAEPDRPKRADLYKKTLQKVAEDSPAAFIVATNSPMLVNKRVTGIAGSGWLHRFDWFNIDVPAE